ncbi:MAG: hypothetical protein A0129_11680 [Limnobacter sp. CACIAM 66H1]|uniref:DUF1294 domain-containing protein n=1 Tax=Limnobacter sp. CACIAM 66H1 TaxID=1813033 RepID=UPI0007A91D93|nr:DUF1294 domain-containing protein [Limnobacter sp. CACIAM 66H1]KYP10660.1 MAG: hypothetical protein A0129_11680 [Limnobacter sp. CACIAM 66H1]
MYIEGTIKTWNDDRGFGFIQSHENQVEVFVHATAFKNRHTRPQVNQRVYFNIEPGPEGKPRAINVHFSRPVSRQKIASAEVPAQWGTWSFLAIPAFVFLFGVVSLVWNPPLLLALFYVVISVLTYFTYAMDKSAAKKGGWRTSESTLHWLSLLGGWPGALVGQHMLRHKSNKAPFRLIFWLTVFVNVSLFLLVASPKGQAYLEMFSLQF